MEEIRLKRLVYRASHRGTREADALIGRFVQSQLLGPALHKAEIFHALEEFVETEDEVLISFCLGKSFSIPPLCPELWCAWRNFCRTELL